MKRYPKFVIKETPKEGHGQRAYKKVAAIFVNEKGLTSVVFEPGFTPRSDCFYNQYEYDPNFGKSKRTEDDLPF